MMPMAPPKHCPKPGHATFTGRNCPECQRAYRQAFDAKRPSARARGYDSKWDKARATFLKSNTRCALCGAPAAVVDHVIPHRGDQGKFWDKANWQALCTPCHSSRKQRGEASSLSGARQDRRGKSRAQYSRKPD